MKWIGSSKNVTLIGNELHIEFTDWVSVFDRGRIPAEFPGLGAIRCEVATLVFKALAAANVLTHFVRRETETSIVGTPFDVREKGRAFEGAQGRMLPLELLFRFVITKKFFGRIERGEIERSAVERLLAPGQTVAIGGRLAFPFVECSTKHREGDAYLTDSDAAELSRLSMKQLEGVYASVAHAAKCLKNIFRSAGFELADGKIEGAIHYHDGKFVIIDSLSPDEVRLIGPDRKNYDKEPVRQWYETEQADWVKRLNAAKELFRDKTLWPEYEVVPPQSVIEDMITRCRAVANGLKAIV